MRWWTTLASMLLLVVIAGPALAGGDLGPPIRLEAGGKPINTMTGHAAPHVCDWNLDGKPDLLVGMLGGGGRLHIYLNVGTATEPRFEDFEPFKVGETFGTVPSG